MLIYLFIGMVWAMWLENFTTKNLKGVLGQPWIWKERFFHWFVWPWSLGTFIYGFIDGLNNRK